MELNPSPANPQQDPDVNTYLKEEKQRPPTSVLTSVLESIFLGLFFRPQIKMHLFMDHKSNSMTYMWHFGKSEWTLIKNIPNIILQIPSVNSVTH